VLGHPTFRVQPSTPLQIEVLRRGEPEAAPNRIALDRTLYPAGLAPVTPRAISGLPAADAAFVDLADASPAQRPAVPGAAFGQRSPARWVERIGDRRR
jgi:hypothetical protein